MVISALIVLLLFLSPVRTEASLDTCREYPEVDPCLPGGVWDSALNSCRGSSRSQCYQCYSGDFCKEVMPTLQCPLVSAGGDPIYLAEYWLQQNTPDPCASTNAHYRPGYQFGFSSATNVAFPSLLQAIQQLHTVTKNAVTDGYSVVSGMGATMIIYAAVEALAEKLLESCSGPDCPTHIDVFTQPPYYSGYSSLLEYAKNAKWNPNASPASPWTVEILTHPNNPDGMKRPPLVTDPERVIMDLVYYWPMYTDIDQTLDKPIMVFSSSKHDGLAGTRFGWALVRDEDLAQKMRSVVSSVVLTVSADIEIRIMNSLLTILEMEPDEEGFLPFHGHGRRVLSNRFEQIREVIDVIPGIHFLNLQHSTGGYAWIHCDGPATCQEEFNKVNMIGISGSYYGATNQEIRFSMMMPTVEFDILLAKIKLLFFFKTDKNFTALSIL